MSNLIKRTLPVILVLAVTISCLISPAAAASDDSLIDILALQDRTSFYYYTSDGTASNGVYTVQFSKSIGFVRYIDLLVTTNISNLAVDYYGYNMEVYNLGNNLYRLIWSGYSTRDFRFNFSGSNIGTAYICVLSAKYAESPISSTPLTGNGTISTLGYSDTIDYNPNDATNERQFTGYDNYLYLDYNFQLNAYGANVVAYDYIDYIVQLKVGSIESISCKSGDKDVPFTVSYLDNSSMVGNPYTLCIRVDQRLLDAINDSMPIVTITGNVIQNELNVFRILSISGSIESTGIDPVIYWFKNIKSNLKVWFTDLIDSVDSLANGSSQDQTNASDFNAAVSDQQQELEDMAGVMDSVTRPALDDVDVNFDQYVSQDDISGMTSPLEALFTGDIFGVVLIMSIMMGTVSFVFYGKR